MCSSVTAYHFTAYQLTPAGTPLFAVCGAQTCAFPLPHSSGGPSYWYQSSPAPLWIYETAPPDPDRTPAGYQIPRLPAHSA